MKYNSKKIVKKAKKYWKNIRTTPDVDLISNHFMLEE